MKWLFDFFLIQINFYSYQIQELCYNQKKNNYGKLATDYRKSNSKTKYDFEQDFGLARLRIEPAYDSSKTEIVVDNRNENPFEYRIPTQLR